MTATLTDPIAAADRMSMADTTAIGSCPLTLDDIQLIPVRYAYVEQKPELQALDPLHETDFRPLGLRPVRDGYLYLFHSSAPDILQEYIITAGGAVEKRLWEGDDATRDQRQGLSAEPAIVVPRQGRIEVLFCETQLTAKKCSMLLGWPDYRRQVMRVVDLGGYCVEAGSRHLLPKAALEQHLAHSATGEASDGQAFDHWYWAAPSEQGGQEPFAHRLAKYDKDHAYLVLDDLTGQINDLLDAWGSVDAAHSDWLAGEDARYYSASFIQGLIDLDENTVASFVDALLAKAEDPDRIDALARIANASAQQRERVANLAKRYQAGPLDVRHSPPDVVAARREQNERVSGLADELATSRETLEVVLEALHRSQDEAEHGSLTGERGIRDFVQVDAMSEYLENAETRLAGFDREKKAIIGSLQTLLPKYHLFGHLYDRQEEEAYSDFLKLDNALINILNDYALASGDYSFIRSYYFGEVGHQHLAAFDIDPAAYTGSVARVLDVYKEVLEAHENTSAHQEWVQTLSENPQLRFATLTPALSAELSNRLAQLTVSAKQELFNLVEKASGARLHERLHDVFKRMKPGLRAHLLDNQLIFKLDLEIADGATLKNVDELISDMETHSRRYATLQQQEVRLENERQGSKRALQRTHKDRYDNEIRRLRDARKLEEARFRGAAEKLQKFIPSEGNQYDGILRLGGLQNTAEARAVNAEIKELEALKKRSGMKAVFDHARGLVHGEDMMDITKRIGGLGVVSFMGLVSFAGVINLFTDDDQKSVGIWRSELASAAFGTIGAVASVSTIVASARLNYYYQSVSKAETVLTRLARANVWGGTIAAWGGFFAAGADSIKQVMEVFGGKNTAGSRAGAGITFAGDSMIVFGSGRIAWTGSTGIYHILVKQSADVTWASVHKSMLQLGGGLLRGMNAWLWAGTLFVLVGQYIYNRYKRSELQAWCESSDWGKASKGWPADEQRYQLAKVIYQPELSVMAEREPLKGRFRYCALRLTLPGVSALKADNAEWVVLERQGVEWSWASEDWRDRFLVTGRDQGGVSLQVSLLFDELETVNRLYIAVRYKPDGVTRWLPGSGEAFHCLLELGERGNVPHIATNEDKVWQQMRFREKPDERLEPLLINYRALRPQKDKA